MFRGQKGDQLRLAIHFKLTTNIGFVGLPNAGKSTLLKAMAPERHVKIADYPFTTLKPQVFDIKFDEQLPTNYEQVNFFIVFLNLNYFRTRFTIQTTYFH